MRVTATAPTRLSLAGGGTDLPVYYEKFGGVVVNMAINLRQKIELTDENKNMSLFKGANPKFYKAFIDEFSCPMRGVKTEFDARIEGGLGSSASAATAMVSAINKAMRLSMSRRDIVNRAWEIETQKLGLYGGKQDQLAAAYGGMNTFYFNSDGTMFSISVKPENAKRIASHILLFYIGFTRSNVKIQEKLKVPNSEQLEALHKLTRIARDMRFCTDSADIFQIGGLLDEAWQEKKKSNRLVTNPRIDELYSLAQNAGAYGGKIMGSGGGGYMFFIAEKRYHGQIKDTMRANGCEWVDFGIDFNGAEARIL